MAFIISIFFYFYFNRRYIKNKILLFILFLRPLFIHMQNYLNFSLTYEFSRQLRLFTMFFVLKLTMNRVWGHWRKLTPVLSELLCLNFDKTEWFLSYIIQCLFQVFISTIFTLMKAAKLLLFLAIYLGFNKSNQGRNLKMRTIYFLNKVPDMFVI